MAFFIFLNIRLEKCLCIVDYIATFKIMHLYKTFFLLKSFSLKNGKTPEKMS